MTRSPEFAQPPAERPVFDCEQPDGSRHTLDLTEPGVMGDFAFRDQSAATRDTGLYCAYHTETSTIFTYMLAASLRTEAPAQNFAALARKLEAMTADRVYTEQSQMSFSDHQLAMFRELDGTELTIATFNTGVPGDTLSLAPTERGVRFAMRRPWDDGEVLDYGVEIPYDNCWQFIAGMVWRSYGSDAPFPELSRHSSTTYQTALAAFGEGHHFAS